MLNFDSMAKDSYRPRIRKYAVWALEAVLFVVFFIGISAYQARNLLETDGQPAPGLIATTLQGEEYDLAAITDRPILVYFFAPWCPYCSASADNVVRLRRLRANKELEIVAVALDWKSKEQIEEYARDHELNVPVLLADASVASDWKVYGFPTYYVLDSQHRVMRRDVGYSTQLGLWWRSWTTR